MSSSSSSSSSAPAPAKASFASVAAASGSGVQSAQQEQEESQKIVTHYKGLRAQITELANKIAELDSDRNEHQLVLRALTGLDPQRRCYRSIGGVLVERTIAEVQPAVEKNAKGIEEVITRLSSDLKQLEKDADEFRIKHNIQMSGEAERAAGGAGGAQAQREGGAGVLA